MIDKWLEWEEHPRTTISQQDAKDSGSGNPELQLTPFEKLTRKLFKELPCKGYREEHGADGYDYCCGYGSCLRCEDCVCNGGRFDPRKDKLMPFPKWWLVYRSTWKDVVLRTMRRLEV